MKEVKSKSGWKNATTVIPLTKYKNRNPCIKGLSGIARDNDKRVQLGVSEDNHAENTEVMNDCCLLLK